MYLTRTYIFQNKSYTHNVILNSNSILRLPRTSSIKMVDAWLLFTLLIPFAEVLLHTRMEQLKQKLDQMDGIITFFYLFFIIFEKVKRLFKTFRHQQCLGKRQRPNEFSKKESQQKIKVFHQIHNFVFIKNIIQISILISGL